MSWRSEFEYLTRDDQQSLATRLAPRVNQIDGAMIERELCNALLHPIASSTGAPRSWFFRFKPELEAAVKLMLLYGFWRTGTRIGDVIQNITPLRRVYSDEGGKLVELGRRVKALYVLMHVIFPYGLTRVSDYISASGWSDRPIDEWRYWVWKTMYRLDQIFHLGSLVNFLVFLVDGQYRSLTDRSLRVKYVPIHQEVERQLDLEFVNRVHVWEVAAEVGVSLLPFIPVHSIKRSFNRLLLVGHKTLTNGEEDRPDPVLQKLERKMCAFCYIAEDDPSKRRKCFCYVPYESAKCGHVYCYYCLMKAKQNGDQCLRCLESIDEIEPFRGSFATQNLILNSSKTSILKEPSNVSKKEE